MLIAILGDSHYKEISRFDECVLIHEWIANDIKEREVGLVCHTGDVYDGRSTPIERHAVTDWVRAVTDHCPLIIVRGNHDALGDLSLLRKLKTKYPVVIEEAMGIHTVAGISIACMAWPRKAELMVRQAVLSAVGNEQANLAAQDLLRNILRGFRAQCNNEGPHILLAHAMVRGSKVSTGQELVGTDFELGLEDLALTGAPLVALGHIHKSQEWHQGDIEILYTGSPRRTNFGEIEDKSYTIASFEGANLLGYERVVTPARPLVTIDTEWIENDGFDKYFTLGPIAGSEIRFRYDVKSDQRETAKKAALEMHDKLLEQGAISCKIEEKVTPSMRAKLPEITTVSSIEDKLKMYWESRNDMPNPSKLNELFRKVRELEIAS